MCAESVRVEALMSIKLTCMFLLLALMSFLWAYWWPFAVMRIMFLLGGLAFLFVATAYAGRWPGMIGKSACGLIHPAAWLLYWPYFLLTRLTYLLFRLFSKQPAYHMIQPGLYLGRRLDGREARNLSTRRILGVLDLTAEFNEPAAMRRMESFLSLPMMDATAPSQFQLQAAVYWIRQTLRNGPVYVHCALGLGRAATAVAAYLLAAGSVLTAEEAVLLLKSIRPHVDPSSGQILALERFAASLHES